MRRDPHPHLHIDHQVSAARRDLIGTILVGVVVYTLASAFDFNEHIVDWARINENWEVDELPIAFALVGLGFGWYAYRRWREYSAQLQVRISINDQLTREIAEHKRTEELLLQAQKMEVVGQLTGGVAHDFNNLLTIILGNLELLRDDTGQSGQRQALLDSALRATTRGADLTRHLLAFSRKQTLSPRAFDLKSLVGQMSDMLHRTLGETIEVEYKSADHQWLALADPGQVENALLNLAINARDAMPNGGRLTIKTENIGIDDEYVSAHAEVAMGDYVLLSVSDSGVGMSPEAQEHAFEPFFTTKEVGQGSGLGLSMVYGFAKQSSGHAAIYSEVGHGTTVKLYLPRTAQVDLPAKRDAATDLDQPEAREGTILVVEDDPDVLTLAVGLLGDIGYDVLQAKDGASAITVMKRQSRIDLLFTDVVLAGGMSGPELVEEAKLMHPAIRTLFMSGYPKDAMVHRGTLGEGADLLNKPFRKAELARRVRAAL